MAFRLIFSCLVFSLTLSASMAGDGYRLWLRYDLIESPEQRAAYTAQLKELCIDSNTPIASSATKELSTGIEGLLGSAMVIVEEPTSNPGIVGGVLGSSAMIDALIDEEESGLILEQGYILVKKSFRGSEKIIIAGRDDMGLLYGSFRLLKEIQRGNDLTAIKIVDSPKIKHRLLNHWDNLDRTVERGYAGFSIWNWHQLPEYMDPRYTDYARANASLGINGTVVTNVNANSLIFRPDYLDKVKALADLFRNYGIRVYLTARFSSPMELGGMDTADPLSPEVISWWENKAAEIYERIPDFGGFLVKANSEGQPGPQDYERTHADGANMLAKAVKPYGGIVMWRAFVYSHEEPDDRAKQAYDEFVLLDGRFEENVLIQVKNGPIDFQPREPAHPLFGAMPQTPLMLELQITKEYLGQGTHLVGLSKMYEEVLETDMHTMGAGTTLRRVIDGSLYGHALTGIAGVSNIGTARNWTGNLFGQADWFAFGQLAWDPYLDSKTIFREWIDLTFRVDEEGREVILRLLEESHELCVSYMTPLGLHHIMAAGHHFGPGPWVSRMSRADWTSVYYHKADEQGIGFDRTQTGSNALGQYHPDFQKKYANPETCPLEFLLWFHHVSWDQRLSTGRTLWEELCIRFHSGAAGVIEMKEAWKAIAPQIDQERFDQVLMHLEIQEKEAKWWRDACISYFQSFSGMQIPDHLEKPQYDLEYYKKLIYPYAPGIRPRW